MGIESLEELRVFVEVVEAGGLTAAAQALGTSVTTVSRRLAALEGRLGAALVLRTTRRLSVTADGQAFYERCLRILDAVRAAEAALTGEGDELAGRLRVGLPSVVADAAHAVLKAFLERHPGLELQLVVSDSALDVMGQGLDVAVIIGAVPDPGLVARHLATYRPVLAAAPAYLEGAGDIERPEDLVRHSCLGLLRDGPQREWTLVRDDGRGVVVPLRARFTSDDSRTLTTAMYDGQGIGVRPLAEVRWAEEEGLLVHVLPGWCYLPTEVWVVFPAARRGARAVERFIDQIGPLVVDLAG